MTEKMSKQEKLAINVLTDILVYEVEGWQNGLDDGEIEAEEYNEAVSDENLDDFAQGALTDAYKDGYLASPISRVAIEAKHLKFLGKKKLIEIKNKAIVKAKETCQL